MKDHYLNMLEYNRWANNLFLECLSDNTVANARAFLLMSHLLTAEEIWLSRLKGEPAPNERLWHEYPLPQLKGKAEENTRAWISWLQALSEKDFSLLLTYRNSRGETFSTAVADVLNHVINHSTYHRAQVAGLLRLEEVNPPVSDYIRYVRLK